MNPQETLREQIISKAVVHGKTSSEASSTLIVLNEK